RYLEAWPVTDVLPDGSIKSPDTSDLDKSIVIGGTPTTLRNYISKTAGVGVPASAKDVDDLFGLGLKPRGQDIVSGLVAIQGLAIFVNGIEAAGDTFQIVKGVPELKRDSPFTLAGGLYACSLNQGSTTLSISQVMDRIYKAYGPNGTEAEQV